MNALTPRTRIRLSPWQEMEAFQDRFNRLLSLPFQPALREEPMEWMPVVDLMEAEGEYVLTAELPGMKSEDVELDLEENVLTLKGEKKALKEEKEGRWHLMEQSHGAFERCFTLPRAVQADKIKAGFADGVLTIHLPKRKEATGRKIQIENK